MPGYARTTLLFPANAGYAVSLILGVLVPPSTAGAEPPELALFGNDQILWVYQRQPESAGPDASSLRQFAYREAVEGGSDLYLPLPIEPARGRVIRGVVRGRSLHVFYGDGTHRRYVPGKVSWKEAPIPVQFAERALPQSVVPAALAADGAGEVLYALVSARRARELGPLPTEEGPLEDGVPEPSPPPLAPRWAADYAVVRYEQGHWWSDRYAPPDLTVAAEVTAMLARKGGVHLFYCTGPEPGRLWHCFSAGPDGGWSKPVSLPVKDPRGRCCGGWHEEQAVLLAAQRQDSGTVIEPLHLTEGTWTTGQAPRDETDSPVHFVDPVAWSVFDGRLAVAGLNEAGAPQVSLWSLADGTSSEPPTAVVALTRPPPSPMSGPAMMFVQYGILAGALAAVFVWRRERVLKAAPLQPGQALARLPRRALALVIDMAILFPVWGPVLFALWQKEADGMTLREQLALGTRMTSTWLFWSWAIVGAIVGLYAMILEAMTHTTLGKWLTGLCVVGEDGNPCRFGPIAVRNLARTVEFQFLPLVVLVALTPSRQRLGDLLARTVVVERVFPGRSPTPPTDEQS